MFRVLIVDDHEHLVESLIQSVPWQDLNVTEVHKAFNGYDALDMMQTNPIDIVITDIRMPGINGIELIKQINAKWKRTRCILLTGYAEFDYAREAIQYNATDYLLKPVQEEELIEAIHRLTGKIQKEWEQIGSYQQALQTLRENLPNLQEMLLNELLQGKRMSADKLQERLHSYSIPFELHDSVSLAMIRLDDQFSSFGTDDLKLMQFAVSNIAKEIFGDDFILWTCTDVYGFLILLIKCREAGAAEKRSQLESAALQLQKNVGSYLKGKISVLLSEWGSFPDQIVPIYQSGLHDIRQRVGNAKEFFITVRANAQPKAYQSLLSLYEYPTFTQLLESGRWEALQDKLHAIIEEATETERDSQEYVVEIYLAVSSSVVNICHKNGQSLQQIFGDDAVKFFEGGAFRTLNQLGEWCARVMNKLVTEMNHTQIYTSTYCVKQVHDYLNLNLSGNTSLQAIADHVHLHPVYLSRMYKAETGENLSEYLLRMKMSKAEFLLKNSYLKINEIAAELGYDNSQYFIKVFRKQYGLTPKEFRDSL